MTIQDDRWRSLPWGVEGGSSGAPSHKLLVRADGTREELPSKCDLVPVATGDRLVFVTAGAGGLGDPGERQPEAVRQDLRRGLVSPAAAARDYGIAFDKEET